MSLPLWGPLAVSQLYSEAGITERLDTTVRKDDASASWRLLMIQPRWRHKGDCSVFEPGLCLGLETCALGLGKNVLFTSLILTHLLFFSNICSTLCRWFLWLKRCLLVLLVLVKLCTVLTAAFVHWQSDSQYRSWLWISGMPSCIWSYSLPVDLSANCYQLSGGTWYVLGHVCLCVVNLCKQDISKVNLWTFAKFIADTSYTTTLLQIMFRMAENATKFAIYTWTVA